MRASRRCPLIVLVAVTAASALSGCATPATSQPQAGQMVANHEPVTPETQTGGADVVPVAPMSGGAVRPDVLVTVPRAMSATEVRRVTSVSPGSVAFTVGTVRVAGAGVRIASVDPEAFRRYAPAETAASTAVWQVVASGGVVSAHVLARRLNLPLGKDLALTGVHGERMSLRLGALATTGIPGTDLVVGTETGRRLGLHGPTSVLLASPGGDPVRLAAKVRKVVGPSTQVDLLSAPAQNPVAFLTGSRAARAFGAFSYRYFADGTIQPDAHWVRANIVSTRLPLVGLVTCHRLMIPQLRGALRDVVNAGLSSSIQSYDGCYVPRFIERDPSHAISLHTWGIAIDLNASTNGRGIRGTMDQRVVDIFKRWGFRWGGDWSYSDPMHFEIGALLNS
ncbi:MAG: hypothetical protein JWM40_227 [Frankiales bacterium]|nr:hypothetical protein [Frankiales bacterium]